MKKYLFLLFLLFFYLFIINTNKTENVISYIDKNNQSVLDVTIMFENGINSKKLEGDFNKYKDEYFIYNIVVNKKEFNVKCSDIKSCINSIYAEESYLFDETYLATGFKVDSIKIIGYKNKLNDFLDYNNFTYVNN